MVLRQLDVAEVRKELTRAVGEHGVIQGVLRIEVLIERRLAHADAVRQLPEGDAGDAILTGEVLSGGDDLGNLRLPALGDGAPSRLLLVPYH